MMNLTVVCNVTDHLEKLQTASCSSISLLLDFTKEVRPFHLLYNYYTAYVYIFH